MKDLRPFYFTEFEDRRPDPPLETKAAQHLLWQILAACAIGLGAWYLWWRWTVSLNPEALLFSSLVAAAETASYIGMLLFFHNLWTIKDTPKSPAPKNRSEIVEDGSDRLLSVDVFLPTYNEDPELTRYSIRDAKAITYPHPIDIRIHVLDDGNRPQMKRIAIEEGVTYITRRNNLGFKAGNLRNAMGQTDADFILILDADTRPFPTILEHTLGYFRDPKVAWVQTPQWFYDIPQGRSLAEVMADKAGQVGAFVGKGIEGLFGPMTIGKDPFISDPKLFYDVIQRRRNCVGASFCCGAGSIHRRDAVMEGALRAYSDQINSQVAAHVDNISNEDERTQSERSLRWRFAQATEFTPYKFHVSEDIYTSIVLHSDPNRKWISVHHPDVESRMLSPMDLKSWAMQRYKYAGGTLDILFHDNPLFQSGMGLRQKLMYAMTFWSYLSPFWIVIFLFAPIFSLISGITPVAAYSDIFFWHFLPFIIVHELALLVTTWGLDVRRSKMLNIAFFSFNIRALINVICGNEIRFDVTPKLRSEGSYIHLVYPQIAVVGVTMAALTFAWGSYFLAPDPLTLSGLLVNSFWALINAYAMTVLIYAAFWTPDGAPSREFDVMNREKFRRVT